MAPWLLYVSECIDNDNEMNGWEVCKYFICSYEGVHKVRLLMFFLYVLLPGYRAANHEWCEDLLIFEDMVHLLGCLYEGISVTSIVARSKVVVGSITLYYVNIIMVSQWVYYIQDSPWSLAWLFPSYTCTPTAFCTEPHVFLYCHSWKLWAMICHVIKPKQSLLQLY